MIILHHFERIKEKMKNNSNFAIVTTTGLVVGNLIGAGILALPISLGLVGTIPSFFAILLYTSDSSVL